MLYNKQTITGTWYTGEPDREMWVLAYFIGTKDFVLPVFFKNHKWMALESASISQVFENMRCEVLKITPTYWMPFPDFNGPNDSTEAIKKQNIKMKFIGL
jgi:hypothetical protein